jgi:preprotein translocase subunit SecG
VPAFAIQGLLFFMFQFLLIIHAIIAGALVLVILMQRSEGGGLGMGGSPSGLMSARGAADFLTRATSVLATLFVGFSVVLAVIASTGHNVKIDPSLARTPASMAIPAPTAAPQTGTVPANAAAAAAAGNVAAPAGNNSVPVAQ